ncbi:hypothetical protein HDU79_003239 [Rhizoclosmatium sp. JEL0117]|nr:hypothetical protein HDU79_003239 [Rhizoclosmatium sp. JEL0117]
MKPSSASLESQPPEIIEDILLYLPIDFGLVNVGLASRQLASIIFQDPSFATRHFTYQRKLSRSPSVWDYLEKVGIKNEMWLSLPFVYQTAIYRDILSADSCFNDLKAETEADDLMWSLRWQLSPTKALKMVHWLLDSGFDPAMQDNRLMLWAARAGWLDVVDLLMPNPNSYIDEAYFLNAAVQGHVNVMRRLHEHPRMNTYSKQLMALQMAAFRGQLEVVQFLFTLDMDPHVSNNIAIRTAVKSGNPELVRFLLKDTRVNPAANNNEAFVTACGAGNLDIVNQLLADRRVNPSEVFDWRPNAALYTAIVTGHAHIVERLLQDPRVNPSYSDENFVVLACEHKHIDVVKVLIEDDRVKWFADVNNPRQIDSDVWDYKYYGTDNFALRLAAQTSQFDIFSLLADDPRTVMSKEEKRRLIDIVYDAAVWSGADKVVRERYDQIQIRLTYGNIPEPPPVSASSSLPVQKKGGLFSKWFNKRG